MRFRYSQHAEDEMKRRGIPRELADGVLRQAQQVVPGHSSRKAYQSKVMFEDGRTFLLRLIVDEDMDPAVVVTIYRTSKIEKYWRLK